MTNKWNVCWLADLNIPDDNTCIYSNRYKEIASRIETRLYIAAICPNIGCPLIPITQIHKRIPLRAHCNNMGAPVRMVEISIMKVPISSIWELFHSWRLDQLCQLPYCQFATCRKPKLDLSFTYRNSSIVQSEALPGFGFFEGRRWKFFGLWRWHSHSSLARTTPPVSALKPG